MPPRSIPKLLYSVYSMLDEKVLNICNAHHCFLIGGTALEILMNFNNLKFNRKRSENDFDFVMRISNSPHLKVIDLELCHLEDFTKTGDDRIMVNFNSDLVEVDILVTAEKIEQQDILSVGDYRIMSPVWMFASKFSRYISIDPRLNYDKFERDRRDLFDLLTLINLGGAEELTRLETKLGEAVVFDEDAERKLQELVADYKNDVEKPRNHISKKNLLFVCTNNKMRSASAYEIYKYDLRFNVRSAGTDSGAATVLTRDLLEWADSIVVMETHHRSSIRKLYPDLYKNKKIVCLYIPDDYEYMQPELISVLRNKFEDVYRRGLL